MADSLKGKRVAILVTDGFEQVELTGPKEALEKAGATAEIDLDVVQLLEQIALTLAGEFREVRRRAVAVDTVAGATHCNFALTSLGVSSRVGHTGDAKGQQQTHEYFVHQLIQLRLRV